ncbi:MAG: KOW domain-containing RNA-binding protein [Defluviitaleaceae bacterium]|nr:KOW domain-containing RNA-binding protein [Defluviitaleaceae bacterium]
MNTLKIGQIVISKAGRDKGQWFVVVGVEGDYALLADGKGRSLEGPKRKKRKHIQHTNYVAEADWAYDAHIRKIIKRAEGGLSHG